MKKPEFKAIPTETAYTTAAKETKKKATGAVKQSFSLTPDDLAYINATALELGQKRGKNMSASEALRMIIAKARGQS